MVVVDERRENRRVRGKVDLEICVSQAQSCVQGGELQMRSFDSMDERKYRSCPSTI